MPSLSADAIEALIDQYLIGDLDARTAEQVRAYLDAMPERRGVMAAVRTAMRGEQFAAGPIDAQAARQAMLARLDAQHGTGAVTQSLRQGVSQPYDPASPSRRGALASDDTVHSTPRASGVVRSRPTRLWEWATVAMMTIAALLLMTLSPTRLVHIGQQANVAMSSYKTGKGERATITLPDGNTVALNVDSHLDVPADYVLGNHTVRLVGEGVFTILHHDKTPFIVMAGDVTTRVLGTTFLVRHYSTDTLTTVAVREGRIALRRLVVTAAEQVVVSPTKVAVVQRADPTQFSFTKGVLTLEGVPFPAAIAELDRWYDTDIRLGDPSLARRHVAGEYAAGSIADLASILQLTFNVRVVRDGRVLTLYPR